MEESIISLPIKPLGRSRTTLRGLAALHSRLKLLDLLSPDGKCGKCKRVRKLEVHHLDGKNYTSSQLNRWARVARYWKEFKAGVRLAGWCKRCNSGTHPYYRG